MYMQGNDFIYELITAETFPGLYTGCALVITSSFGNTSYNFRSKKVDGYKLRGRF